MELRICLIDDDPDYRFLWKKYVLNQKNVIAEVYESSIDFGKNAKMQDWDYIFLDFTINHGSSAEAMARAIIEKSEAGVVFISEDPYSGLYVDEYVENPRIYGLIDKVSPHKLMDWVENRLEGIEVI